MQIISIDASVGKETTIEDSTFLLTPIIRNAGHIRMVSIFLEEEQTIPYREASVDQLVIIVRGNGWVQVEDSEQTSLVPGQAAFFPEGEYHVIGTEEGLVAFIIEGVDLYDTIPLLYSR
ncbi:cupin domain-containing protein [Geomicrobium sp. JCM 19055]|uniref:cupin domain-containing protein n=1 Tax=Geomicrobium sp. JCM 19055 TaxID=1460649 RepID=UPI00045ECF2A|nr:hypothetical protein [Geomicrobium sp. JCM 19055]GAJ98392.1 hypothetical protein JCM19055_1317 [Geomicrobium sp. JCM 19055]